MINTVKKAISIINCFTDEKDELGINELAQILNLNNSTIHHLVTTLYNDGILVKTSNRKYRIGSKVLGWSNIVSEQYKAFYNTVPYLDELVYKTSFTAQLAVRENYYVSTLYRIKPDRTNRIENRIGEKLPLYCTSLGKILLSSSYTNDELSKLELIKHTENTICNIHDLKEELEKVKDQEYAENSEEYKQDVSCIAVPIKNRKGIIIGAISLSNSVERMREEKDKVIHLLRPLAKKISYSILTR